MKTELVNRRDYVFLDSGIYVYIIILIVTMAISGCIPYVYKYTGANPGTIRAGSTSKAKIVKKLGNPDAKTFDGRFFIYDYSKVTGWCFMLPPNIECFPYATSKGWVLIEFDTNNIIKHRGVHICTKSPDPLCDQPGTDIMWTMITQLLGEDVAAQYGHTLDEFRQIVARTESLHEAVRLASLQEVKRHIDKGADISAEEWNGDTPLHVAASAGHIAIAKLLLSNGAAVNHQKRYRETPLHDAAWYGHVGMAALLLANGADVNARDSSGDTPLLEAVARGNVAIIKLLLAKGASVNARDASGGMSLHTAIRNDDTMVVQLLLTHGADANAMAKGWLNNRPVRYALDLGGREDIIELLKQHGAKE